MFRDRQSIKNMLLFGALLLFVRVVVLIAVGYAVKEKAFTDDWIGIMSFITAPFQILSGNNEGGFNYWPPLFPILVAMIGQPLNALVSDYYTVRGVSIAFELLCWPMIWVVAGRLCNDRPATQRGVALAYILAPVAIMTTSIMGQDETVALAFILLASLAILGGRLGLACLICGLGVVSAKVYLLIPLTALVLGTPGKPTTRLLRAGFGLLPIVVVYGYVGLLQIGSSNEALGLIDEAQRDTGVALLDFHPEGPACGLRVGPSAQSLRVVGRMGQVCVGRRGTGGFAAHSVLGPTRPRGLGKRTAAAHHHRHDAFGLSAFLPL